MLENNLYNPILDATRNVFQLMLDLSEVNERTAEGFSSAGGLDISIGLIGDLQGKIIYCFPRDTSLNMVKVMSGMEVNEIDDFVTSAISEIANIISGNVLTALAENDVKCDILPPEFYQGSAGEVYQRQSDCCIATPIGDVRLDIRINYAG